MSIWTKTTATPRNTINAGALRLIRVLQDRTPYIEWHRPFLIVLLLYHGKPQLCFWRTRQKATRAGTPSIQYGCLFKKPVGYSNMRTYIAHCDWSEMMWRDFMRNKDIFLARLKKQYGLRCERGQINTNRDNKRSKNNHQDGKRKKKWTWKNEHEQKHLICIGSTNENDAFLTVFSRRN